MAKEKSFEHAVKNSSNKRKKKVILRNKFLRFADFSLNMDAEPLLELYWVFNVYLATVLLPLTFSVTRGLFKMLNLLPK